MVLWHSELNDTDSPPEVCYIRDFPEGDIHHMRIERHALDQPALADPWLMFCSLCKQKMRLIVAIPASMIEDGEYRCTYECAYGHKETFSAALP